MGIQGKLRQVQTRIKHTTLTLLTSAVNKSAFFISYKLPALDWGKNIRKKKRCMECVNNDAVWVKGSSERKRISRQHVSSTHCTSLPTTRKRTHPHASTDRHHQGKYRWARHGLTSIMVEWGRLATERNRWGWQTDIQTHKHSLAKTGDADRTGQTGKVMKALITTADRWGWHVGEHWYLRLTGEVDR